LIVTVLGGKVQRRETRLTDTQTHRDIQTHTQTDIQRHTDRHTETYRHIHRQTYRDTHITMSEHNKKYFTL